ncbi:aldo/keto reductase [Comamonadaceae bacterium M7527]|nr:aldo/keto reductase [Comamonadaceae bacterium M7527]
MTTPHDLRQLGQSDLKVGPICLGTMTFGEQVDQATAFDVMSTAFDAGVTFWDTAEMYAVPAKAETCGVTETIMGNWFAANPGKRQQVVLATKVAGPSRGMPWIRGEDSGLSAKEIVNACDASLKRLQTDVIDLYQIHWPARNTPLFGQMYFNPSKDKPCASILEQLQAMAQLVRAGKVRAIGLSNETSYGVHEFVRLAEQHGLPRIATVQNAYHLLNRSVENGLDETMHRLGVSLLPYSPLAFGLLTGKYDELGLEHGGAPQGRMAIYESMRAQRWGRPAALAGAKRYNALARELGLTPTQLALAFCKAKWQVASTIIGVTTVAQLQEDIVAFDIDLSADALAAIDALRFELGDPAI